MSAFVSWGSRRCPLGDPSFNRLREHVAHGHLESNFHYGMNIPQLAATDTVTMPLTRLRWGRRRRLMDEAFVLLISPN